MELKFDRKFNRNNIISSYKDGYIISDDFHITITDKDFNPIEDKTILFGNDMFKVTPDQSKCFLLAGDYGLKLFSLPDFQELGFLHLFENPYEEVRDICCKDNDTLLIFSREMEHSNNGLDLQEYFDKTNNPKCSYYSLDNISLIRSENIREDCEQIEVATNSTQEFIYTKTNIYARTPEGDKELGIEPIPEEAYKCDDKFYIPVEDGLAIFDASFNKIDTLHLRGNYLSIDEKNLYRVVKGGINPRAASRFKLPNEQLAFHLSSYDIKDDYAYLVFHHSFTGTNKLVVFSLKTLEEVYTATFYTMIRKLFIIHDHLFLAKKDEIVSFTIVD